MNIVLFDREELAAPLPADDRRARHITGVLGLEPGDRLRAGIIDGPAGWATLAAVAPDGSVRLDFAAAGNRGRAAAGNADDPDPDVPPPLQPVTLLLGHPRPIVLRRMLRDLSTLGVSRIVVVRTELGEKSYLRSNLWEGDTVRRLLIEGAEQAGATALPRVARAWRLADAIGEAAAGQETMPRVVYDTATPGAERAAAGPGRIIAVGSERGWTDREREMLAGHGFRTAALGGRILRTETAAVAAVTLTLSELGLL